MLDIKNYGRPYAKEFFIQIADLIATYHLSEASLTFSQDPLALKVLGDVLMTAISVDELKNIERMGQPSFAGRWWFPLPDQATSPLVADLKEREVLVIAAINRFRYPAHAHIILAKKDIQRLNELGVDGFQIDSLYYGLFE
jgi:hypothetical protein